MATQTDATEQRIVREYQIAATTSPSAAILLTFPANSNDQPWAQQTLIISASGADVIFNFGDSSVVASAVVDGTSKSLPPGNFTVPSGAIFAVRVNPTNQNYVSVITATGSGTGIVRLTSPLV